MDAHRESRSRSKALRPVLAWIVAVIGVAGAATFWVTTHFCPGGLEYSSRPEVYGGADCVGEARALTINLAGENIKLKVLITVVILMVTLFLSLSVGIKDSDASTSPPGPQ